MLLVSVSGTVNERAKTYNSGYSLVVTDPTTNPPICGLCMAERTGCPIFHSLWLYVVDLSRDEYIERGLTVQGLLNTVGWVILQIFSAKKAFTNGQFLSLDM